MTPRSRVRLADALAAGVQGWGTRRVRSTLSALGIAVAIAAVVAVLGIAASAKADLLSRLGRDGNLLTVAAGQTFDGNPSPLPVTAEAMVGRLTAVQQLTAVGAVSGATVRRSAGIKPINTGGISVLAVESTLPRTLSTRMAAGLFLGELGRKYPETVLGFQAAANLGVGTLDASTQVYLGGRYFTVVGVLAPVGIAPELDNAAFVSFPQAQALLGLAAHPTRLYLRVDPDRVREVVPLLPFTASPAQPEAVEVRRPSDVLVARLAAKAAFVSLFLGLGAVALLVGGVGIANIMVISVYERRGEIGLRRAMGARRRHIGGQFVLESALLAGAGGLAGVALGIAFTAVAARVARYSLSIPPSAPVAGLIAAGAVGVLAGIYPALRAARLSPADALRTL